MRLPPQEEVRDKAGRVREGYIWPPWAYLHMDGRT